MEIQPGLKAKLLFIFIVCSNKIQNRVMLSGKGNENGEKTVIGLQPKKNNFARAAYFFVHFFAVVLHDSNVKLPETSWLHVFPGGNVVRVLVHLFIHCRSFFPQWPIAFLIISPTLQNFHVVLSTKFDSFVLISRSGSLSLFFSLSFPGLQHTFSFSLCFSCCIFKICGHDN